MWKRDLEGRRDDGKFRMEVRGMSIIGIHYVLYLKLQETH